MSERDELIGTIKKPLARMYNGIYGDEAKAALAALDRLAAQKPEPLSRMEEIEEEAKRDWKPEPAKDETDNMTPGQDLATAYYSELGAERMGQLAKDVDEAIRADRLTRPEPSSGEPETRQTVLDQRLRFLARAEKAEGEAKALREALVWISQVNAMDYEYQAHARAALATKEGTARNSDGTPYHGISDGIAKQAGEGGTL
jgi:hypothetical protein